MVTIHQLVDRPPYSPDLPPCDFSPVSKFSSKNQNVVVFENAYFKEKRFNKRWEKYVELKEEK